MKKNLLLFIFLLTWGAAGAQTSGSTGGHSLKTSAAFSSLKAINPNKTATSVTLTSDGDLVSSSANQPAYWSNRVFIKLKSTAARLQTYDRASSNATARSSAETASNRVSTTLRKFSPSKVNPLKENMKVPSLRNTYEVVVDKAEQLDQLLAEMNQLPEVEYAERVPYYVLFAEPNDPQYVANGQYYLKKIKAIEAFALQRGTNKTLLAIVDDGLLYTHPDLSANVNLAKSYDVSDGDADVRPPSSGDNKANPTVFSHGTHCAGVAGAVVNNSTGIASVSNNRVSLMGVKATSDYVKNSEGITDGLAGMLYAIEQGARVISMSFGGEGSSQTYQNAINDAAANGVVFVAAAGNEGVETLTYPAAYDNVIAVASSDENDKRSSFSNYGYWVDITAPGSSILSTVVGQDGTSGSYGQMSGTSMATPLVAGMAALMLAENPALTPQALLQIMRATADPIEVGTTYTGKMGGGRINVLAAIQAIQQLTGTVAPSAITDLKASDTKATSTVLTWTAPSVSGTTAATLYEIRYSTAPITTFNFDAATKTKNSLVPGTPGASQTLTVTGLEPGTRYYFAVKARSLYGEGTLSNVVTAQTLTGARLQVSSGALAFNINRNTSTTASQKLTLSNTGTGAIQYKASVVPVSGPHVKSYGNLNSSLDYIVNLEKEKYIVATKFVAGAQGFTLTHVQDYFYLDESTSQSATLKVQILKGGSTPANATSVYSQSFPQTIAAGISKQTFDLTTKQQFQANEVFWVAITVPAGIALYQGLDEVGAMPGTFYLGDGTSYEDVQTLDDLLAGAVYKIKAMDASWLSATLASATVTQGQSQDLTVAADVTKVVNGTYTADLQVSSNDVLEPLVTRSLQITITGGQPALTVDKTTLDFGSTYVGASRTQKLLVRNTGVANLVISSLQVGGGNITPSDISISPAAPFTVLPDQAQELNVTFKPSKKENLAGTLTLASNDPATPTKVVTLTATLQNPPVLGVTPGSVSKTINKANSATATENVQISNTGEADLAYKVQVQVANTDTIKYDPNANETKFLGFTSTELNMWVAMKFNVTQPTFSLAAVQNYYRTMSDTDRGIVLRVYKGGEIPSDGTLLLEQNYSSAASAGNGGLITIPLENTLNFVKDDIFWVVIKYNKGISPQGTAMVTSSDRNYISSDGSSDWEEYTQGTFRIRAIGAPTWLTASPTTGTVAKNSSGKVVLSFDATNLSDGTYTGNVIVKVDDVSNTQKTIPVTLTVGGTVTGISDDLPEVEGLVLYPNPTDGKFTVKFTAEDPENVQLLLVNQVGKIFSRQTVERFRGDFVKDFDLSAMSAGMYILKVQYGNKVTVRKVIVQ